ncbi:TBC1 domain family member 20-like [Limulus polyphemus]|uniref:TBC1 domain family member 20-like n=1 Tax=Limulus polyphemus TaxID=6850 RepID=A0ABM1BRZ3_LIMPO|nr:TBC1 domain family member 20-like [Limulus polyphemus]
MRRRNIVTISTTSDSGKNQTVDDSQDQENSTCSSTDANEQRSFGTNDLSVKAEPGNELKEKIVNYAEYDKVQNISDSALNNHSPKIKVIMAEGVHQSETQASRGVQDFHRKFRKIRVIRQALEDDELETLFEAAVNKCGLVDDEIRRKVWPKLAGVDVYETSPRPDSKVLEMHNYYSQVVLDVNRSLKRFPPSIEEKRRLAMQDQLVLLIMRILVKYPDLHYYQGYHDICVTFLLVLGEEIAFNVIEKLSTTHLRVFMDKTMERTNEVLECIYPLLYKVNPVLHDFLLRSDVGVIFSLSWVITWYGHVLNCYSDVVRLFDLFLASHPWMPLYLAATIVLHRESEIMDQDCDMACVHSVLSKIPDDLPFEILISKALDLFDAYPPEVLKAEQELITRQKKQREAELTRRRLKLKQVQQKGLVCGTIYALCGNVTEYFSARWTVPITMAAAVVFYAVIYQFYNK